MFPLFTLLEIKKKLKNNEFQTFMIITFCLLCQVENQQDYNYFIGSILQKYRHFLNL